MTFHIYKVGKLMNIECRALPMLPDNTVLDVWKMKIPDGNNGDVEGVAITISTDEGVIVAGVHLTKDQWRKLIALDF